MPNGDYHYDWTDTLDPEVRNFLQRAVDAHEGVPTYKNILDYVMGGILWQAQLDRDTRQTNRAILVALQRHPKLLDPTNRTRQLLAARRAAKEDYRIKARQLMDDNSDTIRQIDQAIRESLGESN